MQPICVSDCCLNTVVLLRYNSASFMHPAWWLCMCQPWIIQRILFSKLHFSFLHPSFWPSFLALPHCSTSHPSILPSILTSLRPLPLSALKWDGVVGRWYSQRALLRQRAVLQKWAVRGVVVPVLVWNRGGAARRHIAVEPVQTWEEEEEEPGLCAWPGGEGSGSCSRYRNPLHSGNTSLFEYGSRVPSSKTWNLLLGC